jgi:transposase InsO family protein
MSTREKLITARLGMLALAEELQNISKACKVANVSRSHYYEIKKAYETYGRDGLVPRERRKPRMPNQTPPEIESRILEMTERYPTFSYFRISEHLRMAGVNAGSMAVRGVWERYGITRRMQRLLWMEKRGLESGRVLTEELKRLLARYKRKTEDPEQHVESHKPGYLLCQDTYYLGTIKGVGRIYMQSVVDTFCSIGFAKLYLSKLPITAVDVLHERVLPFYEEKGIAVENILTDNGREYCGRALRHPFELYLAINEIEHRNTKVQSPQTNGFCERFHQTVGNEFVKVQFRKKIYTTLPELQEDLDAFLEFYNNGRAHQGYRVKGRTPMKALNDYLETKEQEVNDAA